jgi:hypothetical protein
MAPHFDAKPQSRAAICPVRPTNCRGPTAAMVGAAAVTWRSGHAWNGMAPARPAKWRATAAGAATSVVITIECVDRNPDPENAVIAATGTGNHQTDGRLARLVDGNRQGTPIHVIDQGGVA